MPDEFRMSKNQKVEVYDHSLNLIDSCSQRYYPKPFLIFLCEISPQINSYPDFWRWWLGIDPIYWKFLPWRESNHPISLRDTKGQTVLPRIFWLSCVKLPHPINSYADFWRWWLDTDPIYWKFLPRWQFIGWIKLSNQFKEFKRPDCSPKSFLTFLCEIAASNQ